MICPNCGKEIDENAAFCRHCGSQVLTDDSYGQETTVLNQNQTGYYTPPQTEQYQTYAPPQANDEPVIQQYNYQSAPSSSQQPVEEKASVGLAILSFLIPLAGLIIFCVDREKRPKTAKVSGICALVSVLIGICASVIANIAGAKVGANAVDSMSDNSTDSYIASEYEYDDSDDVYTSEDDYTSNDVYTSDDTDTSDDADSSDSSSEDEPLAYECDIENYELCTDYNGKDALLVTYEFNNNSDEAICFYFAFTNLAVQNGVQLDETELGNETDEYSADTAVEPGATQKVKIVYLLNDTTSPIFVKATANLDDGAFEISTTVEPTNMP